jgi:hypothetical protein
MVKGLLQGAGQPGEQSNSTEVQKEFRAALN